MPCSFVGKYQSAGGSPSFHLQDKTILILHVASRCKTDKDTREIMFLITGYVDYLRASVDTLLCSQHGKCIVRNVPRF